MRYDFFIAHPGVHAASAAALEKALHARGRTAFRDKSQRGAGGWREKIKKAQQESWITLVILGPHSEGQHPWFEDECTTAVNRLKPRDIKDSSPKDQKRHWPHGVIVVLLPDWEAEELPYGLGVANQLRWSSGVDEASIAEELSATLQRHLLEKWHSPACLVRLIDGLSAWLAADPMRVRDVNRARSRLGLDKSEPAPEGAPLVWPAAHALYGLADQAGYEQHALSSHRLVQFVHALGIAEEVTVAAVRDWLDELASQFDGRYEDTVPTGPTLEQFLLVDVRAGEVPGIWRADLVHREGTTGGGWEGVSGKKVDEWEGTDLKRLADRVAQQVEHLPEGLAIEVILPVESLDEAPGLWCNNAPSRGHGPLSTALCNHGLVYVRVAERFGGHRTLSRWQTAFQRALKAQHPAKCCQPGEVPKACESHGAVVFEALHARKLLETLMNQGVPIASWADEPGALEEPPRNWRFAVQTHNMNGKNVRLLWDDPTRLREPDAYYDLEPGSDVQ